MNRFTTRWIATFVLAAAPAAHATFTSTIGLTLPSRPGQHHFTLADGATRVIDVGAREPSRIFDIGNDTDFLLISGEPSDPEITTLVERKSTHEIFYLADQSEGQSSYRIRRYLRGYNLSGDSVATSYSERLYSGTTYSAPVYSLAMSLDESVLYYADSADAVVNVLNLTTHAVDAQLTIPDISYVTGMREIRYKAQKTLAVLSQNSGSTSSLVFYDLKTSKNVFTLTSDELGLSSSGDSLRLVELSPDTSKAIFCQIDRCLVVNLLNKNIIADLHIDGTSDSSATFSPDGRYIFVTEYNQKSPLFSVVNATDGSYSVNQIPTSPVNSANKTFATLDKKYYVRTHGDRLYLISAVDGKLLQTSTPLIDAQYDDLAYTGESPGVIKFITTKTSGVVEKWELSL